MTIPRAGNYNCLGDNTNFNNAILGYHPAGFLNAKRIINELYTCSDEGDMQGRFNNNVSKIMAAIFQSEGIMCKLSPGDPITYRRKELATMIVTP